MCRCTVCNDWYPSAVPGVTDICLSCLELNFSGASPPLDLPAPLAREMLEAYVDTGRYEQLTPRREKPWRTTPLPCTTPNSPCLRANAPPPPAWPPCGEGKRRRTDHARLQPLTSQDHPRGTSTSLPAPEGL